jgi:hypothetical protein
VTRLAFPEPAATTLGDLFGLLTELRCNYSVTMEVGEYTGHGTLQVRISSALNWNATRALGEWADDIGAGFSTGSSSAVALTVWLSGVDDDA